MRLGFVSRGFFVGFWHSTGLLDFGRPNTVESMKMESCTALCDLIEANGDVCSIFRVDFGQF